MEKTFFKIIVPNYNNMPYIKKCLDSIFGQTFQDFKIIVVDDQSDDFSDDFCEMYARQHANKIIFHRLEKKGYAGAARNWGIDYPDLESEYTWFVDSDDWLYDDNVLKNIYDNIIANNFPDLVRCSFLDLYANTEKQQILTTNRHEMLTSGSAPWKNVVKTKFNVKFSEQLARNNDIIWFYRLFDKIDITKISVEKNICIVYNRASILSSQNSLIKNLSIEYILADRKIVNDLKKEVFMTKFSNDGKQLYLEKYLNKYNPIITYDDFKNNSFVITIDNLRYQQFKTIFEKKQLPVPCLFTGSQDKSLTAAKNCTQSHLNIIKTAKKEHMPYVFVFEDDAYPCKNIYNELKKYLYCIPKNAEFILFGWSNIKNNEHIQKLTDIYNKITNIIYGSHAYVIFANAYDKYIQYVESHKDTVADGNIYLTFENSYIINRPLFIQYSKNKSMNSHSGYILYGDHEQPPPEFEKIENLLN